jgi:hypothetical protein
MYGQQVNWDSLANQLNAQIHSKIKDNDLNFASSLYISMIRNNHQLIEYFDANVHVNDTIYITFFNHVEQQLGNMSLWVNNRIKDEQIYHICAQDDMGRLRTDTALITNGFVTGIEEICLEWDKKKIRKESKLLEKFYPYEEQYKVSYYLLTRTIIKNNNVFDIDCIESRPFWNEICEWVVKEQMKKAKQKK